MPARVSLGAGRRLRWSRGTASHPPAVWIALGVGVLGLLAAVTVLISVFGLIGSAEGVTAGTLRVPTGSIAVVVVLGYLIAFGLLAATAATRSRMVAGVLATLAVIIAIAVSVYPLVATGSAAVDQGRDVLPWILDLIRRVR